MQYFVFLPLDFKNVFNGYYQLLFFQFDPLFTYKKQKDGNYTFGGLVYQIMNDAKNYFDLR